MSAIVVTLRSSSAASSASTASISLSQRPSTKSRTRSTLGSCGEVPLRLQRHRSGFGRVGFPRGHTDVPYRGKPAADGPRYKALGNSMAVPVMRWIGERITQHLDDVEASTSNKETP